MKLLRYGVYSLCSTIFCFGLSLSAGADEPVEESTPSQTVAFFWNGDEVSTLHPTANIADVIARYQERGARVVQAVGMPPVFFKQFVMNDRKAHPEDYAGKNVTLVINGHGARYFAPVIDVKKNGATPVQAGLSLTSPPPEKAPMAEMRLPELDKVKDEEIILAFIEGIGDGAKAEAISSQCFFGQECLAVSLNDTPLATRVSRLIVPKKAAGGSLSSLVPPQTPETVFARLSDILVQAIEPK